MKSMRIARRAAWAAVALGVGWLSQTAAASASDKLPDLIMMRLTDIQVQNVSSTRHLLRYSTRMANKGVGAFEVHGSRASTSASTMSVTQRIYTTSGTRTVTMPSSTVMFYAGDGHNHWHVKNMETGKLTRLDNGVKAGTLAKTGFCFFDNVKYNLALPGAPLSPHYTYCGSSTSLSVTMGLSVGWGDLYPWNIAYQYIDISSLTSGKYRLTACANNALGFVEANYSDNCAWADIQITGGGTGVNVLRYG